MTAAVIAGALVLGVVVLTPVAQRAKVPQPVVLTVFGALVALAPGTPALEGLRPALILPVVLPPLLFAATQRTTVGEFREHAVAVVVLAVGLTVATVVVTAVAAHVAGLPWTAAWLLGAIVSPPDPVAATAVARELRLPPRLVTILEGEGMFNDATALVIYKVAVAAVVSGDVSVGSSLVDLALAVVVGTLLGLVLGWVVRLGLALLHDAYAETTLTVLAPFVAYLGAEHLHGSGVLAVLTYGLFLRSFGHDAITSRGWLLGRSVWNYTDFLLTSLVFALVGYELVQIFGVAMPDGDTLRLAATVLATIVVFRALWVFPAGWLSAVQARRHEDYPSPVGWRESAVVSWSGMRGVVTVATALAVPATVDGGHAFADRGDVVMVALGCVLVTLLVQGLTLGPLVRGLGVGRTDDDRDELVHLRRRAADAAVQAVREAADVPDDVRRAAATQVEGFAGAQSALEGIRGSDDDEVRSRLGELLRRATDAERELVLEARRRGEVSSGSADAVLRDIEWRALRELD